MIGKILEKQIAWSTIVQILGKGAQIAIGFFTVKLLTEALGTENYGVYGKITEFSLFFSTAGNLGIFGNMVRKMADNPRDSKLFWNALLLRLWTALFFFGMGLFYAVVQIHDPVFLVGTLLFMSSLLLDYITSVCDGTLQAEYKMGRATLALVSGRAVNLLTTFLIFHSGQDHLALYLLGPLLGSLVTAGVSLGFIRGSMKIISHWSSAIQKELLWTSLPFGIINLINNIYYRFLPSALIVNVLSNSDYSTYSLSLHLTATLSLFSTFLMFSVLPALKHALKEGHHQTAKELYKKARKSLVWLAIAMVGGGSLLGPWALTMVSTKDFLAPHLWFILPLLLLLAAVSYFYDLTFVTLFAMGKDRWWLQREFVALAVGLGVGALSLLVSSSDLKVVLIISSAIAAEAAMALMGFKKITELTQF